MCRPVKKQVFKDYFTCLLLLHHQIRHRNGLGLRYIGIFQGIINSYNSGVANKSSRKYFQMLQYSGSVTSNHLHSHPFKD
jgi:hypothetical protein